MDKTTTFFLVLAGALILVTVVLGSPFTPLSTIDRISLWSSAEIRCDDLTASTIFLRQPQRVVLHIDVDPKAIGSWPFYYGGIEKIIVNDVVVKTYNPPLMDIDYIDITEHIRMFNDFRVVAKVTPLICNLETQSIVTGWLEVTYSDGGGGGGGGDLPSNTIVLLLGGGLVVFSAFLLWRWR